LVAPHAGAWIETSRLHLLHLGFESHPMRVRGLKHRNPVLTYRDHVSHPMRVRGLKQQYYR